MQAIQTRLEQQRTEQPSMSHHHLKTFTQCFRNYFLGYSEISVIIQLESKTIMGKTLLQITGSAIPVFIQLCLLVLVYEVVQLLQNFLGMAHFNRSTNSMLRECVEIDGQILFFIFSRDGSNSEPPTETVSNFEENSSCICKLSVPQFFYIYLFMSLVIYLLICFTQSKNHSLLLPLTDFRQVISPLIMVLVYLREIRQALHHLKSLHQKH